MVLNQCPLICRAQAGPKSCSQDANAFIEKHCKQKTQGEGSHSQNKVGPVISWQQHIHEALSSGLGVRSLLTTVTMAREGTIASTVIVQRQRKVVFGSICCTLAGGDRDMSNSPGLSDAPRHVRLFQCWVALLSLN